jgi:transcriptional regulator with XRE-family HTH domain
MKTKENIASSQLVKGNRLRIALSRNRMTQRELAERTNFDEKYISKLVNGNHNITNDNAELFARVLGVRAEWLKGETDIMDTPRTWHFDNVDTSVPAYELTLFTLLAQRGYKLTFDIVLPYADSKEKINVDYLQLRGVDLSTPYCCVQRDGRNCECVIESVVINDCPIEFYYFVNEIDRLEKLIDFTIDTIVAKSVDYSIIPILATERKEKIKHCKPNGEMSPKEILNEVLAKIREEFGEDSVVIRGDE